MAPPRKWTIEWGDRVKEARGLMREAGALKGSQRRVLLVRAARMVVDLERWKPMAVRTAKRTGLPTDQAWGDTRVRREWRRVVPQLERDLSVAARECIGCMAMESHRTTRRQGAQPAG